jgi:hypothetical protein
VFTSATPGVVTAHVFATLSINGVPVSVQSNGAGGSSVDAVKRFVDANIQITPPTAQNPVNTTHTLTGHVNVNAGLGAGYVNAPDGTTINFSIVSGPGGFVGPSSCTTSGGTGSCTVVITSSTTGTTVVRATSTVGVGGVSLTRTTGDAKIGDSADASKEWVGAAEGCTPGYWKQPQHFDSWVGTGFTTSQTLGSVFTNTGRPSTTLLQALSLQGGPTIQAAKDILLRAAVAALLNSASPDVDYPLTTAQVIAQVNAALASNDRNTILTLARQLDDDNNLGCPLN